MSAERDDIVGWLRASAIADRDAGYSGELSTRSADEIERLRTENAALLRDLSFGTRTLELDEVAPMSLTTRDVVEARMDALQVERDRDEARATIVEVRDELEVEYALRDALCEEVTESIAIIAERDAAITALEKERDALRVRADHWLTRDSDDLTQARATIATLADVLRDCVEGWDRPWRDEHHTSLKFMLAIGEARRVLVSLPKPEETKSFAESAVDDLWSCIGKAEIEHLQPETVTYAKAQHERHHATDFAKRARASLPVPEDTK